MTHVYAVLKVLMWLVVGGGIVCVVLLIGTIRAALKGDWER